MRSGGTATVGSAHTSGVKSDRVKQEPVRHSNEFEKSIIEHTEQRCARMRAEWLVSESLVSYLQKAQRVIEDETFSTSYFKCKIKLHASIKETLRCVREEKLLKIPENVHFVGRYPLGNKYYKSVQQACMNRNRTYALLLCIFRRCNLARSFDPIGALYHGFIIRRIHLFVSIWRRGTGFMDLLRNREHNKLKFVFTMFYRASDQHLVSPHNHTAANPKPKEGL